MLDRLDRVRERAMPGLRVWEGLCGELGVLCIAAGMGKVNGAHGVTTALSTGAVEAVIGFGIGGAYPKAGLSVGDVAVATSEEYGDEGAETPEGWISCETIGIPLVEARGRRTFNRFELDPALARRAARAAAAGAHVRSGSFLTLSCCSGTDQRAATMEQRFGAICETMEGAAWAHIATIHELPFAEIRGISNIVENRNPPAWRIAEAAEAAAEAVHSLLTDWNTDRTPETDA